jgi:hypothetical protein
VLAVNDDDNDDGDVDNNDNNNNNNNHAVSGSLSPRHGASSGCGWRNGLQYGG